MKYTIEQIIQIFITILILCVLHWSKNQKKSKHELASDYHITKPTLKKWIQYFQNVISPEDWKEKRSLSLLEDTSLRNQLGHDVTFCLSKAQIAERAESNYKTVSANVKKNLSKIGISQEAWDSCNVFPPAVSEKILEVLG